MNPSVNEEEAGERGVQDVNGNQLPFQQSQTEANLCIGSLFPLMLFHLRGAILSCPAMVAFDQTLELKKSA